MEDRRLIQFFLFVFVSILLLFYPFLGQCLFSSSIFDSCLFCAFFSLYYFIKFSQRGIFRGQWMKPSYIFVVSFCIVNFQFLIDLRLGFKSTTTSSFLLRPYVLNHCMVASCIALLSFVMGYIYCRNFSWIKLLDKIKVREKFNYRYLEYLHIVVFLLFLINIDVSSFLGGSSYVGGNRAVSLSDYFEALLFIVNIMVVAHVMESVSSCGLRCDMTMKKYISLYPIISIIIFFLYIILRAVSGDRGPAIYSLLLLLYGYIYITKKKLGFVSVFISFVVSGLLISVVGIARSLDFEQYGFIDRFSQGLEIFAEHKNFSEEESSFLPITEELSRSTFANQIDIDAIEFKKYPLHYGQYQLVSILSCFPFASGLLRRITHWGTEDISSGGFANYIYFGGYDRQWGLGTTILGDFYLEFGVYGLFFFFFIVGFFYKCVDFVIYSSGSYIVLLIALVFSTHAVFIPRGSFLVEFRYVVWAVLLVLLGNFFFKKKS